jgi:hypothetical protein
MATIFHTCGLFCIAKLSMNVKMGSTGHVEPMPMKFIAFPFPKKVKLKQYLNQVMK